MQRFDINQWCNELKAIQVYLKVIKAEKSQSEVGNTNALTTSNHSCQPETKNILDKLRISMKSADKSDKASLFIH